MLSIIINCIKECCSTEELLLVIIAYSYDDSNYYIAIYISRLLISVVRYLINEHINQHHNK